MSVETNWTNQPGDGDADDASTFAYRSADSAATDGDRDDDDLGDDAVTNRADQGDFVDDDATVAPGTVADTNADTDTDTVGSGTAGTDVDDPQPTFTPVDDDTVGTGTDYDEPTLSETDNVPVVDNAATTAPATEAPLSSAADLDPNAPLLGDSVGLRASWQQAQAGFVDDPRTAVAEAAELVEHAAQTLIGSLQQRQRQLRTQWDDSGSGAAATGGLSDTEQLRHLMQDYRNLFNQLVQP